MPNGLALASVDVSFPLLAPNGSAAAPSYSFAAQTGTGIYRIGGAIMSSVAGVWDGGFSNDLGSFMVRNDWSIGWASGHQTTPDLTLYRDAADVLALRRGVNTQTFRLGNSATCPAIADSAGGLSIIVNCSVGVNNGFPVWLFDTAGSLSPHVGYNNAVDIGATGRVPRNIYAGTQFLAADGSAAAPSYAGASYATSGFFFEPSGLSLAFGGTRTAQINATAIICGGTLGVDFAGGGPYLNWKSGSANQQMLFMGGAPSATPLAQTFTIGEASRPGTDSDVGGANGTIRSGLGTGTGTASSLIFQTPSLVASGSTTQTYTTRLTVATDAITSTVPLILPNGSAASPAVRFATASAGFYDNAGAILWSISGTDAGVFGSGGFVVNSGMFMGWSSTADPLASFDVVLARLTAASLRLGSSPSATPVAYTFTVGESSRGTTDNNVAGANGTLRCGAGTGNSAGASLIFQTPTPTASGVVAQAYAQRMSLSVLGATFDIPDQGLRINNQVSGAGASVGTLTNAPAASNPNFWLPINVNGAVYYFPGW